MTLPEHPFLKRLIDAFKKDVPKKEYRNLSKSTVQQARRELEECLKAIPGATFDNVKQLRAQMSIAEMGNWSSFKEGFLEDAVQEYEILLNAKSVHCMKIVIDAFKNDVPKKEYRNLTKPTVQRARRELEECLKAIPGATFDNVKHLRATMSIAEMGNWRFLKEGFIENAVQEYEALLNAKAKQEHTTYIPEQNTSTAQQSKDVDAHNDKYDVRKPRLKHVDTAELLRRKRSKEREQSTDPENKEVYMPALKHVDTAELDAQNDKYDVPKPRLKHVDTAELLRRKRSKEREQKTDPDNEEVSMSALKHVDTAELLRRSKDARKKLCDTNPSIADLSDVYRPTRLAEMYSQSYDNEWTDALEELMKLNVTEKEAIQQLLQYLQEAFSHCKEEVEQIILKYEAEKSDQSVSERLKNITDEEMNNLQKKIGDKINKGNHNQIVRCYIDECVRLTYLMNVQNPPMKLYQVEKDTEFNSNVFRQYTRTKTIDYVVWPALLLYEDGPVASKGVVQLT